ncbi:Chromosomal replication initiator protein DnaA [subsurface metagenome]
MTDREKSVWEELLSKLEKKLKPQNFKTWFKPTQLYSATSEKLTIMVPNDFFKKWLDRYYMGMIRREIAKISGHEMEVDFILPPKYSNIKKRKNVSLKKKRSVSRLNHKFHFNSFVVGNNNRLAHAAALAVAQSPARAYNPLFIYGKVGLGKTHLLQAIGHYITENSELTFTYLSSEQFTNELINAIRDDKTTAFRRRYRNTDVLMVDDIHFLAGKERTQEEFFHTFNALHEAHKQIVLSSDRSPIEIPTLEKRLQSRFEWGLIADIQSPDLETRIAILKKKAEIENMELPDEVATFIAERIKTNIRKLEGCLVRITAHSSLFKEKIDMNSVKEILKGILPEEKPRPITVELVQKTVSKYYKIKESTIKGKKRSRSIAFPRQIAMYLCRELTEDSFPEIGAKFGGKDHTTVMYAYRKIVEQAKKDEVLSNELKELENILKTS